MKELEFMNLSNRWFINIPYDYDVNDLQMVPINYQMKLLKEDELFV